MKQHMLRNAALLLTGIILLSACTDDPASVPQTGSVTGTITFSGTWPDAGDVQVSIYSVLSPPWIPMGPPDQANDSITGNPDTDEFTFSGLEFGDYTAIYVSLRDPSNPAATQLLGMYWAHPDSVGISPFTGLPLTQPTAVTIDKDYPHLTGIDLLVDFDLFDLSNR
ncbi:hypothetical protein ACFL6T_04340 [Candidatus Zixiibacteriota bacterium]